MFDLLQWLVIGFLLTRHITRGKRIDELETIVRMNTATLDATTKNVEHLQRRNPPSTGAYVFPPPGDWA